MKVAFREAKLSRANRERLETINEIIEEYKEGGYTLTLRQLFYQLVSRDIIPNQQKEYSKLSKLLKEGRMSGVVDWEAIEDRLRVPYTPASFDGPKSIMRAAISQYELPRMKGQPTYLEVWVEKDALSGVLKRVTSKYHVPILVCRGYSSVSAMHDAFERFEKQLKKDNKVKILYLGDYDPSGIDMIRDIRDRVSEFVKGAASTRRTFNRVKDEDELYRRFSDNVKNEQGEVGDDIIDEVFFENSWVDDWLNERFTIEPIALTREQIDTFNPPPNPAKKTDPRARKFIDKHGSTSWEVDALRPEVLNSILTQSIRDNLDINLYNDIVSREQADIDKLQKLMEQL